jgi:hypothetical protein
MPPDAFGRRPRETGRKLALDSDGRVLATLSADGTEVQWWDVDAGGREMGSAKLADGTKQRSIALSGGRTFLLEDFDYSQQLATARNHRVATSPSPGTSSASIVFAPAGPPGVAQAPAAPDPTGRFLAVTGHANPPPPFFSRLLVYDFAENALVLESDEASGQSTPVWSADGHRVAFDSHTDVFILDIPTRTLMRVPKTPRPNGGSPYCHVALAADGAAMAFAWIDDPGQLFVASLPRLTPAAPAPMTSSTRSPS